MTRSRLSTRPAATSRCPSPAAAPRRSLTRPSLRPTLQPTLQPALSAIVAVVLVLASGAVGGRCEAETLVLRGATVHPVDAPAIENATLVVEGDTIVALGSATDSSVDAQVPADAQVVELAGRHIYPGFVHPGSVLGLVEVLSVAGTRDFAEMGDFNPAIRTEVAFHADSKLLPATLAGGVLTAHVWPQGGTVRGTSAVMRMAGWNFEDMTVRAPVGMHIRFPAMPRAGGDDVETAEKERKEALEQLDALFEDAAAYGAAREAGPRLDADPNLLAMQAMVRGEQRVFLHAGDRREIEAALDWASERGIDDLVLVADADAQYLAERLAREQVPVILNGVLARPNRIWEPYDAAYAAASVLHEAGVEFAIGDGGGAFGAMNSRNLPHHAAMAAAFGLPKQVALESVTTRSAEILGVADRLGSIGVGKEATFFVSDGDPLEILTQIERVWIAGREIDLGEDHQRRLYERYRNRPRPAGSR